MIATARIAAIQAAKRTAELIPLCHPLPLSFVDLAIAIDAAAGEVHADRRGPHHRLGRGSRWRR